MTRYGLLEIVLSSILCLAVGAVCVWLFPPALPVPALAWVFLLSFFRDPNRSAGASAHELVSPADGTVMDIQQVEPPTFLEGRAIRIGIFMSLLDVHVNRAPMAGTVRYVEHFAGKFRNARAELSTDENEHNLIGLQAAAGNKILVNQIAGIFARRIVCGVKAGDPVKQGQRLGMVKFGSRVELFVPAGDSPTVKARVGHRVKAGQDVLVSYDESPPSPVQAAPGRPAAGRTPCTDV